jgi:hypothetical protein
MQELKEGSKCNAGAEGRLEMADDESADDAQGQFGIVLT